MPGAFAAVVTGASWVYTGIGILVAMLMELKSFAVELSYSFQA